MASIGEGKQFIPWYEKADSLPLAEKLGNERITNKYFSPRLLKIIGHEINHLVVGGAYYPWDTMTLTAKPDPEGKYLGMVTFPGYADFAIRQKILMAGLVSTPEGSAEGFGSDLYHAWLIQAYGYGTSLSQAQSDAEKQINRYDMRLRKACAKIIAYLQFEKGMDYIPGGMFPEIESRARLELELDDKKVKVPRLFRVQSADEFADLNQFDDTIGRPPDSRTQIQITGIYTFRIVETTDGHLETEQTYCAACNMWDAHKEDCRYKDQKPLTISYPKKNSLADQSKILRNLQQQHKLPPSFLQKFLRQSLPQ